jgi:P-type Mg2+ transporter
MDERHHLTFDTYEEGKILLASLLIFPAIPLILLYLPFISAFGFVLLLVPLMLAMLGLTALYVLVTELSKKYFYSKLANANGWIGSGKRNGE